MKAIFGYLVPTWKVEVGGLPLFLDSARPQVPISGLVLLTMNNV